MNQSYNKISFFCLTNRETMLTPHGLSRGNKSDYKPNFSHLQIEMRMKAVVHRCFSKQAFLRPATSLKRGSNTSPFLWNLRNFKNNFLYKTPPVAASVHRHFPEHPKFISNEDFESVLTILDLKNICFTHW